MTMLLSPCPSANLRQRLFPGFSNTAGKLLAPAITQRLAAARCATSASGHVKAMREPERSQAGFPVAATTSGRSEISYPRLPQRRGISISHGKRV